MTNIGHFRAASKLLEGKRDIPVKLWIAPPTKMDAQEAQRRRPLRRARQRRRAHGNAGLQPVHGQPGAGEGRRDGVLDLTRNFPNRLGKNTNVYLGSAELAAICSKLGRIPTREEYMADMGVLTAASDKVYQYLNFDQIEEFTDAAEKVPASV